jgi:hypothetical protein
MTVNINILDFIWFLCLNLEQGRKMIKNKNDFIQNYWDYFLMLEDEFLAIEKVIPIDEINKDTYSLYYMNLYFSICSEIDVLFKIFIKYNEWYNFNKDDNIQKYKEIINQKIPDFKNKIIIFSIDKEIKPFENWNNDGKLIWWDNYNDIKHNRTFKSNNIENYKKANQENIINAFAALYQIEMYFFKNIIDKTDCKSRLRMPVPQSKRLRIKDWCDNIDLLDNRYILYINDENGHLQLEGV